MMHVRFGAMGTGIEAWCPDEASAETLRAWFEEVESVCSRFRPDSELSRVNRCSGGAVVVSEMFFEVMKAADRARTLTDGMVDAGVGSAVAGWGYDRTFNQVTGTDRPPPPSPTPEWTLDSARRLVRAAHTRFDLGGIAKGWSCDRAVEAEMASVVSAGGDIRSVDPDTTVPVIDPWGGIAVHIRLGAGGLATSSTSRRRWKVGTRDVCHVIDPRSMEPVSSPILSATVVAESAADAEAGAKAVLLHGVDGLAWADGTDWIESAVVVWHDGSVYATPGIEVAA
ncbi:MAG TPA: FAD:protein FMN transferase [Acidimicrobiia bacterium]|nr:FAD:protein FMN transferase [Acidimicrobiia bacterium]